MSTLLSKLFGMDIYTVEGEYKGKIFDLIINLEKGRIETITTEPLKAKSKQEAKKIISEKSIPYRNVRSAKDIVVVGSGPVVVEEPEEERAKPTPYRYYRRR
jgi:sporulation protein YlmC with PRC-barrel domain